MFDTFWLPRYIVGIHDKTTYCKVSHKLCIPLHTISTQSRFIDFSDL